MINSEINKLKNRLQNFCRPADFIIFEHDKKIKK